MSIVMNQASVGTVASLVGYIPPAGYLIASGTSAVYLGTGTAVTTGNGYQVTSSAPLVWQNALAAPAVPVYAIASSTAATLSFSFGNGLAGQVIAGGTAALQLDRNAADIQPVGGTAAAGSTGLAADAGHVHVGFTNPMTTPGDLIYESAGTAPARLGIGTNATVLTSNGTTAGWQAPAFVNPMTTKGDLIYESGAGTASRLAVGGSTQVLGASGGVPAWETGWTLLTTTGGTGYTLVNGTASILTWTAPNDGALHRVQISSTLHVTSTETGGQLGNSIVTPDGAANAFPSAVNAGGQSPGFYVSTNTYFIQANSVVSTKQNSALSGGTAVLWAEIWGS